MLTDPEPTRKIEELNDDEIYAAIRYLELDTRIASKQREDSDTTKGNGDHDVIICVCLYIALVGSLAGFWVYLR